MRNGILEKIVLSTAITISGIAAACHGTKTPADYPLLLKSSDEAVKNDPFIDPFRRPPTVKDRGYTGAQINLIYDIHNNPDSKELIDRALSNNVDADSICAAIGWGLSSKVNWRTYIVLELDKIAKLRATKGTIPNIEELENERKRLQFEANLLQRFSAQASQAKSGQDYFALIASYVSYIDVFKK